MMYAIFIDQDTVAETYLESDTPRSSYYAALHRVRFLARGRGADRSRNWTVYNTRNRSGIIEDSGVRAVPVYANRTVES